MYIMDFAAGMGLAGRFLYMNFPVEFVEACIGPLKNIDGSANSTTSVYFDAAFNVVMNFLVVHASVLMLKQRRYPILGACFLSTGKLNLLKLQRV
jgi:hypothetical protein